MKEKDFWQKVESGVIVLITLVGILLIGGTEPQAEAGSTVSGWSIAAFTNNAGIDIQNDVVNAVFYSVALTNANSVYTTSNEIAAIPKGLQLYNGTHSTTAGHDCLSWTAPVWGNQTWATAAVQVCFVDITKGNRIIGCWALSPSIQPTGGQQVSLTGVDTSPFCTSSSQ